MEVFENGIIRREALEQLKREVINPNVVDRCKDCLDPSLHDIVDNIKGTYIVNIRTNKGKGEDVFNDVETVFEIFFPKIDIKQINIPQLELYYSQLREAIETYNKIRKDNNPNGIYKRYMTVSTEEILGMGDDYKKDYNVARFAFIKELIEEIFKCSLVAWGSGGNQAFLCPLLENILKQDENILLFCSDIYVLELALRRGHNNIKSISQCTYNLLAGIKNMAECAKNVYEALFQSDKHNIWTLYPFVSTFITRYPNIL